MVFLIVGMITLTSSVMAADEVDKKPLNERFDQSIPKQDILNG